MFARFRPIIISIAVLGIAAPAISLAEPAPENRWEVDYEPTKCKLIRQFETNGQRYRLEFERSWSFGGHNWRLYGAGLPAYSTATTISLAVEAPARTHQFKTNPYMFDSAEKGAIGWNDSEERVFEGLQPGQHIRLTGAKRLDIALNLPNLSEAKQGLEACEDDLFAGWGIDAKQARSVAVAAKPANYPGRWVTNDDYPPADFVNRNEGTTTFLLAIGVDGAVTGCRIVGSSGFATLDTRTCALLMKRAIFHPAEDAEGRVVPSFYINTIRWRVPR